MATTWTPSQLTAINTKNKTLLLSAAAGSGKTTTLTERIIRSITDKENPGDISKMLIVTFTRASATDLKTKIFNAVSDALAKDPSNRHLTSQLIKLGSARISTIDSFYLSTVRQNFSALGISSSFRIADESETMLMAKNVMSEVIDRFYDTDSSFSQLCECFEKIRDTSDVMEKVLLNLYVDCLRTPEGISYLKLCSDDCRGGAEREFFDTAFGTLLKRHLCMCFSDFEKRFNDILSKMSLDQQLYTAYYDAFDSDRMLCIHALNILNGSGTYSELSELLCAYKHPNLRSLKNGAGEYSAFCKSFRDIFKQDIKKLKEKFFCYSPEDFCKFYERTADNLFVLYRVLTEFDNGYREEKQRRNILELTDIKRYALMLFANKDGSPTELAKKLSEQFSDIYIDEYQDVDPVQDLIFRCIATPTNRFMVGDIKQSIYSFRGARPQLFADYRTAFPVCGSNGADASDSQTVYMSENFRCARPVIDFTNLICSDIFRACGPSIGYTDGDDLVYGKRLPNGALDDKRVTVAVFAKNQKSDISPDIEPPTASYAEAMYVAHEIHQLIKHGKKQDSTPIRPCDIAVLSRNRSGLRRISEVLSDMGILTTDMESTQYFNNPDVMMMLCILNAVDNPQRDIHLAGAMRSPIFNFSLDDLLLINTFGSRADSLYDKVCICASEGGELGARCDSFLNTLERWRSISVSLPIDKLLNHIFSSDTFVASGLVCEKDALGKGGHLKRLYEYARTFEAGSFKGLYNFIEFINALIENGKTIDGGSSAATENCVTLSTIHNSKGLEFPVCFVVNAAADFGSSSRSANLSFEYGTGVAMTLSDPTGFAYYESPLKKVLDLNTSFRDVEEEMRILYVALTRAKEQLYVTGSYPTATMPNIIGRHNTRSMLCEPYFILSASCYMDWIIPKMLSEDIKGFASLYTYTTDSLPSFDFDAERSEASEHDAMNTELYEYLTEKFSFKYPYAEQRKIPAKLSVSKLSPDVLDSSDTSVDIFDTEKSIAIPDFFLSAPKKATASERGTATHLFLQFCDFGALSSQGVDQTLAQLTLKGFIPPKIAECVYKDELQSFCHSELINEILSAERIIREQRFNILLPASDFSQSEEFKATVGDEKIAVQGVIDLIIITADGKIQLYDYKTDRLTKEELKDPKLALGKLASAHSLQLSYYATAVEQLFGKAPDRVAVYSTHAARLFDITPHELNIPPDIL